MSSYLNTNEELQEAIATSFSIRQVLIKLDIVPAGGNYETIKRRIKTLNLDTSHFKGQGWNLAGHNTYNEKKPLQHYFDGKSNISTNKFKERLIKEGIFERKCYGCDLTTWKDLPIPLELDHINGDRSNNTRENLRLLCPNCHAQTPTYRRSKISLQTDGEKRGRRRTFNNAPKILRKTRTFYPKICVLCNVPFNAQHENQRWCSGACHKMSQRKVERPTYEALLADTNTIGFTKTGRKYGVSDNTIRNWMKRMVVESSHSKIV